MSFAKAQDLLRLAQMAAARRGGVSLEDICIEFDVSHRTAQRMTEALEATFVNVSTADDAERRRYWRLAHFYSAVDKWNGRNKWRSSGGLDKPAGWLALRPHTDHRTSLPNRLPPMERAISFAP